MGGSAGQAEAGPDKVWVVTTWVSHGPWIGLEEAPYDIGDLELLPGDGHVPQAGQAPAGRGLAERRQTGGRQKHTVHPSRLDQRNQLGRVTAGLSDTITSSPPAPRVDISS